MYARVSYMLLREDVNYLVYFRSFCSTGLAFVRTTNPTDQNIRYIVLFHQRELKLSSVSFFSAMGRWKSCFFSSPVTATFVCLNKAKYKESWRSKQPHLNSFHILMTKNKHVRNLLLFPLEPTLFLCSQFLKQHKKIKSPHFFSLLNWNEGRIRQ